MRHALAFSLALFAASPAFATSTDDWLEALAINSMSDVVDIMQGWCAQKEPQYNKDIDPAVAAWKSTNHAYLDKSRAILATPIPADMKPIFSDYQQFKLQIAAVLGSATPQQNQDLCLSFPSRLWMPELDLSLARQKSKAVYDEYLKERKDAEQGKGKAKTKP